MKRKLFTAFAILALFTFTACQEDAAMEELVEDIELNQLSDPDDPDDDGGIPPTGGN